MEEMVPKGRCSTASRGIDMLAFWGVYIHNVVSLGKEMICLELDLFIQCFVAPFFIDEFAVFLVPMGFRRGRCWIGIDLTPSLPLPQT